MAIYIKYRIALNFSNDQIMSRFKTVKSQTLHIIEFSFDNTATLVLQYDVMCFDVIIRFVFLDHLDGSLHIQYKHLQISLRILSASIIASCAARRITFLDIDFKRPTF